MRSILVSLASLTAVLAMFPPAMGEDGDPCANDAPSLPALVGNGMKNGAVGWAGLPYFFNATSVDADGDPVAYAWSVDGQPLNVTGPSLRRAFGLSPGVYAVSVRAVDDPSARGDACAAQQSEAASLNFFAVEPSTVSHVGPELCPGPCVPLLLGEAAVQARATDPHGVLTSIWFVLDGGDAPVRSPTATRAADGTLGLDATLHSEDVARGSHRIAACAQAEDDVHRLVPCSRSTPFVDLD